MQQKKEIAPIRAGIVLLGAFQSGKSTVAGHLLYSASKEKNERLFEKMKKESAQIGKATFLYMFMVNNLKAERERGITINCHIHSLDLSPHFLFTLIDVPGHPSYYKTAISGISQADIGLVVINPKTYAQDLQKGGGLREQLSLATTMGIKSYIFAINMMETISYSEKQFQEVQKAMRTFTVKTMALKMPLEHYIPISGLQGHNLTEPCEWLSWYKGPTVLDALKQYKIPPLRYKLQKRALRISIRNVFKIGGTGTVPVGRVLSGVLTVGSVVQIEPGNIKTEVKSIQMFGKEVQEAKPGDNIGFNVKGVSVRDLGRGKVVGIFKKEPPQVPKNFLVKISVLKGRIREGYAPTLHCMTGQVTCVFKELQSKQKQGESKMTFYPKEVLAGEMASVKIVPMKPIVVETFADFQPLGRLIFRDMNQTVAIGKVIQLNVKGSARSNLIKRQMKDLSEFYLCPITQDVMMNPVILVDGHTYEKEAIEDWLKLKNTSPLTGVQLPSKQMIPNYALKGLIQELEELAKKRGEQQS